MDCLGFRFSRHAIERMFLRGIAPQAVEHMVRQGEVIVDYPKDKPFPSALVLGYGDDAQPVHVVVAREANTGLCHVVTVYRPDPNFWTDDFRTRRQR